MTEFEELFHQIALDSPNAKEGKMFGAMCIKSEKGKAAAIFWNEEMMFKLGKSELDEALKLEGARIGSHLYDSSKAMKGWVTVAAQHSDKWATLTQKAIGNLG